MPVDQILRYQESILEIGEGITSIPGVGDAAGTVAAAGAVRSCCFHL